MILRIADDSLEDWC